jgi:hypothetical protein
MRRPPGGGAGPAAPVSCCLSAVGIGFLGHPAPAGELNLPHGRPTGPHMAGPQRGCRVALSKTRDRAGRSLYPGDGGALPAGDYPPAGTCRSSAASPYGPAGTSHRRGALSRDVNESSSHSPITPDPAGHRPEAGNPQVPAGLLLPRRPRMEQEPLRLLPRASHPAVTRDARRGRDRPSRTGPGTTPPA